MAKRSQTTSARRKPVGDTASVLQSTFGNDLPAVSEEEAEVNRRRENEEQALQRKVPVLLAKTAEMVPLLEQVGVTSRRPCRK